MELIEKNKIRELLPGLLQNPLIFNIAFRASGFKKINTIFKNHFIGQKGIDFIDNSFEKMDIKYVCPDNDLKNIPLAGPFIVISNHPYGFLDGLIMIRIFSERFPGFKTLSNYILTLFNPIKDYFIEVDPFTSGHQQNVRGLKQAIDHVKAGNPLGIFPAGEVATYYGNKSYVDDKEWGTGSIRFIEKAGVPVIPMYFHGQNSKVFHLKGRINPFLRTISLPSEFLKKKGEEVFFRIGAPIKPDEFIKNTTEETKQCLRTHVNALKHSTKEDKNILRLNLRFKVRKPEPIIDAIDSVILENEVLSLPAQQKLISKTDFDVYYAKKEQIPNIIIEIGRLREITFRQVGEGSNKSVDLDKYDDYYEHLFVWNRKDKDILGGYRLGRGELIMNQFGKKGFYVPTLFEMDKEMNPILEKTIEMGRSFVVEKYQKKPHSLFLLWNGIVKFIFAHPTHNFLMGPVSISNDFSRFSKELIMSFIRQHHFNEELARFIHPKNEFKVKGFNEKDVKQILEMNKNDLKKLDNYISTLEIRGMRIPVLVKKYLSQNAKVVGFNVDPDFNYCLDGLMILDMNDLPKETLELYGS
jgi:putative hemolysin